ncbi:MAG: MEDS domain-containing protein [Bacillota bacterium]
MLNKELLTVEEVAAYLRTTPNTVYRWLRAGKLTGVKIGKEWRINKEILLAFLAEDKKIEPKEINRYEVLDTNSDHVLVVTTSAEQLYDFEADYFKEGLSRGHRLFKGCWWQHSDDVRKELDARGIPVDDLEEKDILTIVDLSSMYKSSGVSQPVQSWSDEANKTVRLGYSTMWGSGSPHLLSCDGDVANLIKFEQMLDNTLKNLPVVGICPYIFEDCIKEIFNPLVDLINYHSSVIFYDHGKTACLKNW